MVETKGKPVVKPCLPFAMGPLQEGCTNLQVVLMCSNLQQRLGTGTSIPCQHWTWRFLFSHSVCQGAEFLLWGRSSNVCTTQLSRLLMPGLGSILWPREGRTCSVTQGREPEKKKLSSSHIWAIGCHAGMRDLAETPHPSVLLRRNLITILRGTGYSGGIRDKLQAEKQLVRDWNVG